MQSYFKSNSVSLVIMSMVFVTVSVAADAVAYKFVQIGPALESGDSIIFPLTYLLGDAIAEVYGYITAKIIVWIGLFCEILFALLVYLTILIPSPNQLDGSAYNVAFGHILRFVFSGLIADIASSFLNIYLISKWKILMRGRFFWLRSLASTWISEFIMVVVIIACGFTGIIQAHFVFKLAAWDLILHLLYTVILVWPTWMLAALLKRISNTDVYEPNIKFNHFSFKRN